jgi:hypothetical protein
MTGALAIKSNEAPARRAADQCDMKGIFRKLASLIRDKEMTFLLRLCVHNAAFILPLHDIVIAFL